MAPRSREAIYRAENANMAQIRLAEFEAEWGKRYPAVGQAWRRAWEHVVPFFAFAPGIRKMIYTTDPLDKRFLPFSHCSRECKHLTALPAMLLFFCSTAPQAFFRSDR